MSNQRSPKPSISVGTPQRSLSTFDAIAMVVGIVIGAGIFRLPPLVAANVSGPGAFIAVWIAGGLISLVGALCYAELASTYPNAGGDYYFLMRAFGRPVAFLFGWARMMVTQTGLIAWLGFVIGDYVAATVVTPSTTASAHRWISSSAASSVVIGLTLVNMIGVRLGKWSQVLFTLLIVIGLLLIVAAGLVVTTRRGIPSVVVHPAGSAAFGMAMVFVLLTYGGWNEAAYLSAEMKGGRRSIVVALVLGIASVTFIYLLVNLAYMSALGFDGLQASTAVGADVLNAAWGKAGAILMTAIVIFAILSTANGTIFTGARSNYALGRDFPVFPFRYVGRWADRGSTPRNALLAQGLIALVLVQLGGTSNGVQAMVDYTSPVFWFFFFLVGLSLFVLRWKDPATERPFRVPLYPILPAVFCASCGYMFYASLAYVRLYALAGVAVLAVGVPVMLMACRTAVPANGAKIATRRSPAASLDD